MGVSDKQVSTVKELSLGYFPLRIRAILNSATSCGGKTSSI
jgi:hypothetical protein